MVLHLSNDYSGSNVYKNLIAKLDALEVSQLVFTAVKSQSSVGRNAIELCSEGSEIIYENILNTTIDRIFYRRKLNKVVRAIESKVDLTKIKLIHAHTWYSDGGVAYKLFKKYNIPYIITIRNTDLNVFHKYIQWERRFGRKIVDNAHEIICISPTYKVRFLETIEDFSRLKIDRKVKVIPNGVDEFWLKNFHDKKTLSYDLPMRVLYIGKFNSGKNTEHLIEAFLRLTTEFPNLKLTLIGGGGDRHEYVLRKIGEHSERIEYLGVIKDLEELKKIYRACHIFAMPSKYETFGLVYIEALTQGLPIIYTKGEGLYGLYDGNIGEATDCRSVEEISNAIRKVLTNYENYNIDKEILIKNHSWSNIARKYYSLYSAFGII